MAQAYQLYPDNMLDARVDITWSFLEPLLLTWIKFNPSMDTWMSNHEHSKVWGENVYLFPHINVCTS